mgnify:FL=1|tara:strand:- start:250 stop:732 length:483 start_codon:yes stop_codon:yes gene_type:complete
MTSTKTIQEQLDHALLEIKKLNLKVSAYEKKLYSGIEFVDEPVSEGLFRIDQMNLNWLRQRALDEYADARGRKYIGTITDEMLRPIAYSLAADIEANVDIESALPHPHAIIEILDLIIDDVPCWTCSKKVGNHKEYRDALGEYEYTCDECHKNEYPEQYE